MAQSPWGCIDHVETIGYGVWFVSTPGHGGVRITNEIAVQRLSDAARMEAIVERGFHWFEEDCDWAIPAYELVEMRPNFFQYSNTPESEWEGYLRSLIRFWNVRYAVDVGLITPGDLPDNFYCGYCYNHGENTPLVIENGEYICGFCGYSYGNSSAKPEAK